MQQQEEIRGSHCVLQARLAELGKEEDAGSIWGSALCRARFMAYFPLCVNSPRWLSWGRGGDGPGGVTLQSLAHCAAMHGQKSLRFVFVFLPPSVALLC